MSRSGEIKGVRALFEEDENGIRDDLMSMNSYVDK
jgi:hypothetical protein